MMTDSLPLIGTLLKVGAGGVGRDPLAAGEPLAPGEAAAAAGLAPVAGLLAAAVVGEAAALVPLVAVAAGLDEAAGWLLPQAARIGNAAAPRPSIRPCLSRERRESRWPTIWPGVI